MSERTDEAAPTQQQRPVGKQAPRQPSNGAAAGDVPDRPSWNGGGSGSSRPSSSVPASSADRSGGSDPDATMALPKLTGSGPPPPAPTRNPPTRNPFVPDPPGGFPPPTGPGLTPTAWGTPARPLAAPAPSNTPTPPGGPAPPGTPPMPGPGMAPGPGPGPAAVAAGATARTVVIPEMSPDEREKANAAAAAKARADEEKRQRAEEKARAVEERKRAREAAKAAKLAARAQARTQTQAQLGRKARLKLMRVDPWSVMKTSFLLSIAFGVMCVVAVFLVYSFLTAAGLWDNVNETVARLLAQKGNDQFDINSYVTTSKVMGITMLISAIDVVIITALATLGAFIYNLSASLLGGIEITLAEDQHP
jgi:hypothetical protein